MNQYVKEITKRGEPLFIPYIMGGDPTPEVTIELALKLQEAGAHVLELGVAYSDPLADGMVIQKAGLRALKQKMTLQKTMELVPKMRKKGLEIPVVIFTYYNPVLQLGEENFISLVKENFIDGILIPDLPYEESTFLKEQASKQHVAFISLLAPTSEKRMNRIAQEATGFLYCISSLGVTGVRHDFHHDLKHFVNQVKDSATIPVVVGFGVSTNKQVREISEISDGFVIGSAIVRKIEELNHQLLDEQTKQNALDEFLTFVASLIQRE